MASTLSERSSVFSGVATGLLLLGAATVVFEALGTTEAVAGPPPPGQQVNADEYTSARVCGDCHQDIYESWKNSLHAFSLTDPIFDTAFMQAIKLGGEEARRLCLRCHAPMTSLNGDYTLELGVTREGVSCDFCHTVTAVHLDGREMPYEIDLGPVKRSTIEITTSPAHETAYSELHKTAEFCGGCHNYVNSNGTTILGTYDEWRDGPYGAEGVPCQSCHMALSPGRVARQSTGGDRTFSLHSLIHDRDQLREALTVEISRGTRTADGLDVEVVVENVGSGHKVPTGMPTREVVLTVVAEGPAGSQSQQRRYRKIIADESGRPLDDDVVVILRGARLLNDTRIAPREQRVERFRFRARDPGRVTLRAELTYEYAPAILNVQRMNIRLAEAERIIY